jgi:hypothetical protein
MFQNTLAIKKLTDDCLHFGLQHMKNNRQAKFFGKVSTQRQMPPCIVMARLIFPVADSPYCFPSCSEWLIASGPCTAA